MEKASASMGQVLIVFLLSAVHTSYCYSCSPSGSTTLCRLDATQDVWLEGANKNSYDFLIAGIHPGYPLKRSLLKFEDIPSNCQEIVSASMHVYFWYAHKPSFMTEAQVPWIPRPVQARQVLKSWSETEATPNVRSRNTPWSVRYLGLDNTDSSSHVDDTYTISRGHPAGYTSWNVTHMAGNWLSGQPNRGVLLMVSNEDQLGREIRFYSREHSLNRAPYLEIVCATTTPPSSIQADGALGVSDKVDVPLFTDLLRSTVSGESSGPVRYSAMTYLIIVTICFISVIA